MLYACTCACCIDGGVRMLLRVVRMLRSCVALLRSALRYDVQDVVKGQCR